MIYCFVGESYCGKTTFIRNYFNNVKETAYATVGIDFGRIIKNNEVIEFWEIGGHERILSFKRIAEPFLKSHLSIIDVLVVLFNASDPTSLSQSLKYIEWLQSHNCTIKIVKLVGTKTDLGIHTVYSTTDCLYTNRDEVPLINLK